MLCILDVDTTDQRQAALDVAAIIEVAMSTARREVAAPGFPMLYRSGVRYRSQDATACAFRGPKSVLERGHGDCKQLVIWRLAELRNAGEHATPRIIWLPEKSGLRAHALIRRENGTTEDPSVELGMKP